MLKVQRVYMEKDARASSKALKPYLHTSGTYTCSAVYVALWLGFFPSWLSTDSVTLPI